MWAKDRGAARAAHLGSGNLASFARARRDMVLYWGMVRAGCIGRPPVVLVAALSTACGAAGLERIDSECEGAECAPPVEPSTAHAIAVQTCDDEYEASMDAGLGAHLDWRLCLESANGAALPAIVDTLGYGYYTDESVDRVFAGFRYASQCADFRLAASDELSAQERFGAECAGRRERALAEGIDALVDFRDSPIVAILTEPREHFPECYGTADQGYGAGEDAAVEASRALADCVRQAYLARAPQLLERTCDIAECTDTTESFVRAGFITNADASESLCALLSAASPYRDSPSQSQLYAADCSNWLLGESARSLEDALP